MSKTIGSVDPAAKTSGRIRRNWNRVTKGSVSGTLLTLPPLTVDGSGNLIVQISSVGGLTAVSNLLAAKLDTNSGLAVSSGGLKLLLADTSLALGSGGVSVNLASGSGLTVSSGLKVSVDNSSIVVSGGALSVGNGGITLARLGALTSKGDLLSFSTTHVRVPVGTDGQFLIADSSQTSGLRWGTVSGGGGGISSPLTTKGDIWCYSTADTRLGVGSNGQVLISDSSQATGLRWGTVSGGGGGSSDFNSLTFSDPAGGGGTLINRSGWVLTASASGGGATSQAVDSNASTRWATGGSINISGGSFFEIDTGSSQTIGGVTVDDTSFSGDFPSTGNVLTSTNGSTWGTVTTWGPSNISGGSVTIYWSPATARYVQLVPSGYPTGGAGNWWSMGEIYLWTADPGGSAVDIASAETVSGSTNSIIHFRALGARGASGDLWGMRVGPDANNWYGYTISGSTMTLQKAVGGTTTSLATVSISSADVLPHTEELIVSTGSSGAPNWIVAIMSNYGGNSWSSSATDSGLTVNSGTMSFHVLTTKPSLTVRGPCYSQSANML